MEMKEILNSFELKLCKFCNVEPVLYKRDAITILRCAKCSYNARGYIVDNCLKVESDKKSAIGKLVRSWNERN